MQYCTFYLLSGIYHGFALNTKLPDGSKVYVQNPLTVGFQTAANEIKTILISFA